MSFEQFHRIIQKRIQYARLTDNNVKKSKAKNQRGRASNILDALLKITAAFINESRPVYPQKRHRPSHPQPLNILHPVLPNPVNPLGRLHAEISGIEIAAEH